MHPTNPNPNPNFNPNPNPNHAKRIKKGVTKSIKKLENGGTPY